MLLNIEVFQATLVVEIRKYQEFQTLKMCICILILAAEIVIPKLS